MENVDPKLVDQWQLPEMNNNATPSPNPNQNPNKGLIVLCAVLAGLLVLGAGIFVGTKFGTDSKQTVAANTSEQQGSEQQGTDNSKNTTAQKDTAEPATVTVIRTEVVTQPRAQAAGSDAMSISSDTIPCDGRGVLIVSSIIDTGQDVVAEANNVIAQYPNSRMLRPGACSSLRASVDGNSVYPVVIDYGFNTTTLCTAAARMGGNPRIMNKSADFSDPCK